MILGDQILMILSDFGDPGAHFLMIFDYFGCLGTPPGGLGHILRPKLDFGDVFSGYGNAHTSFFPTLQILDFDNPSHAKTPFSKIQACQF